MRRLMVVLAFAGVLAAPARASAMTDSQASKAVSRKLASVYGSMWRTHTPSWSKPECRQVNVRQRFGCIVEFEHAGVWHLVSASVIGGKLKVYRKSERHWVRQWRVNGSDCAHQEGYTVVGELSSNNGGCFALTLLQNYGKGSTGDTVRYTGFKRAVVVYGTGTALWTDFYVFKCKWSTDTYECANRFGDGLRWRPNASAPPGPITNLTEFRTDLAAGSVMCALAVGQKLLCRATPNAAAGSEPLSQVASLLPDGSLTSCTEHRSGPSCAEGDFGDEIPALGPGEQLTIGPFGCTVLATGVQCTVAASGKGFVISPQQIVTVGA
jgi:hypothetical protein